MKKGTTSTGIKGKIITGFVLLLTLIFISVYAVFKLANQLLPPDPGVSSSVRKLTLISNLLSSLIETEGMARAYLSTNDTLYLERFYEQEEITSRFIDTLTSGSINNTKQYLRILTVDSLLDLKKDTYHNFFELKKEADLIGLGALHKSVTSYDDSINVANSVISKTITKQVPLNETKKPGFFPRLWNRVTGKKNVDSIQINNPKPIISYDTAVSYQVIRNKTLNRVRSQLKKFETQKLIEQQLITEREMMLLQADQKIMTEIRAVLLLFEKEEIANAMKETENSRTILNNLWITALILAGAGLLTTIAFIILILKDLAKSAFYRKQLEQARSLAESLLKVKEKFLANMSHEIRTPLTSIIGFTERLSETPLNKEQAKYLKYVNSSSEHLLELINDLLEFSRINSGKLALDSRPFNPAILFAEAFETLEHRAKDKNLDITLRQNIPSVELLGDSLRLKQIVINLLANSIKFTEKGKVILQTKATLTNDGKLAQITVRVADTGIGIPQDKLEAIFEEFTQVDPGITRKYGGSGLGLAISSKLVSLMDGSIRVTSRLDRGTIFTIKLTLPVYQHELTSQKSIEQSTLRDLRNIKVLLAEDDATTSILIADLLKRFNAQVVVAADGAEALNQFQKDNGDYRLIITDIQMPGLSGPELIERIRETCHKHNYLTPLVIGLTAHAETREMEKYQALGMDYFVLKPFKNQDIVRVLIKVFKKLQSTSGLPEINGQEMPLTEALDTTTGTMSTQTPHDRLTAESYYSQSPISLEQPKGSVKGDDTPEQESIVLDQDNPVITNFMKFAGDEDSLKKILASLHTNINATSDEMRNAFENKDFTKLSLLSHRILPNMRLLEAKTTAFHLKKLELICKEDPLNEELIGHTLNESIKCLSDISQKLKLVLL